MKNTFKNIDKITLVGLAIAVTIVFPLLVAITYKVLTTTNIIF